MQSLKLFAQKSTSYRRLSNTSTEDEGDACISRPSTHKEEHDADKDLLLANRHQRPWRWSFMHTCGYTFIALLGLFIGLGLGQLFNLQYEIDGFITQYGSPHRNIGHVLWSQNDSFAAEPSVETQEAWESIMPIGRGFVKHPKLAKEVKAVAVFHQMHCLHGLRTAFYKNAYQLAKIQHHQAQSRSLPNTGPPHGDSEFFSKYHPAHEHSFPAPFTPNPFIESLLSAEDQHGPDHITHCFEYLRQALMCAADTNLEDTRRGIDAHGDEIYGTQPWESERVCRDYEAVKEWAETWRAGDAGGIV